jgi:hypothetical protein
MYTWSHIYILFCSVLSGKSNGINYNTVSITVLEILCFSKKKIFFFMKIGLKVKYLLSFELKNLPKIYV